MVVAETPVLIEDETKEDMEEDTITKSGPVFTLEILKIITDCQQQHGLRHSDYQRYRSYCTRRLQRLRQTLHFPQGDKRHFKRRDVTEDHLKDERFLQIPLMQCERAWGYAMQLRQESNTEPRKKFHLASRLRKAVKYADHLETLCQSELCDARSKLEAQAYNAWIKGSLHFELHGWKEALDFLQQAQVVYDKLCGVVKESDLPIYKGKTEELVPSLRYCAYSIGDSTAISDLKDLQGKASGDILDKLDRLMVEARAKDGGGMAEVEWRGHKIPVRPPSVGAFLLADQELGPPERESSERPRTQAEVDHLERHVIHCKDAISALRDLTAAEQGPKTKGQGSENSLHPLSLLLSYLTYIRLSRSNQRTRLMIELAQREQEAAASASAGPPPPSASSAPPTELEIQELAEAKKGKPHEMIRLYEVILQNLNEMQQLPGLENDDDFQAEIEATITVYKAFRCFYIGEVLSSTKMYNEAEALYERALDYLEESSDSQGRRLVGKELSSDLASLKEKIRLTICVTAAKAVLQEEARKEAAAPSQQLPPQLDLKNLSKVPLIERLDVYYEDPNLMSKKANLIRIPPDMELISCKPLFFDVAQNYIKFPSLEAEKKGGEGGPGQPGQGISGFVKGLWGWGGKK